MLTLSLPFDPLALASLELLTQCIPTLRTTHNMGIKEQAEWTGINIIVTPKGDEAFLKIFEEFWSVRRLL